MSVQVQEVALWPQCCIDARLCVSGGSYVLACVLGVVGSCLDNTASVQFQAAKTCIGIVFVIINGVVLCAVLGPKTCVVCVCWISVCWGCLGAAFTAFIVAHGWLRPWLLSPRANSSAVKTSRGCGPVLRTACVCLVRVVVHFSRSRAALYQCLPGVVLRPA